MCSDKLAEAKEHTMDISGLSAMLAAGRIVKLRIVKRRIGSPGARYIATAIPEAFPGGLVPPDWRCEAATLEDALRGLERTWRDTPDDFEWDEVE